MTTTHWPHPEIHPDKRNNILVSCGIRVHISQVDYKNPTCPICEKASEEYNNLDIG